MCQLVDSLTGQRYNFQTFVLLPLKQQLVLAGILPITLQVQRGITRYSGWVEATRKIEDDNYIGK